MEGKSTLAAYCVPRKWQKLFEKEFCWKNSIQILKNVTKNNFFFIKIIIRRALRKFSCNQFKPIFLLCCQKVGIFTS